MIQVQCQCGAMLKAKDEHAGKATKCPRCGQRVVLPSGDEFTEEPPRARIQRRQDRGPPPLDYDEERPRARRRYDADDYAPPPPGPPLSGKALTAMIVGLSALLIVGILAIPPLALALGVFTFIVPAVAAAPALVFGVLALRDLSRRQLSGRGLAYTGLGSGGAALLAIGLLVFLRGTYQESQRRAEAEAKTAADKAQAVDNLKMLGIALHTTTTRTGRCRPRSSTARRANRSIAGAC